MSEFLYKLGSFAARKAWAVVAIWAVLLVALGGSYAAFKGEMTSEITIPGTEAQLLADTLSEKFDTNTNAGSGQIILETKDGSAFTDAQKQAIATAIEKSEGIEQVDSVSNPFTTQSDIESGKTQLEEAQTQLTEGKTQLEEAQSKIDETRTQLESGAIESQALAKMEEAQAQLDSAAAQVKSGEEQVSAAKQQLTSGQAEIDANRTKLEEGQAQIAAAQAELDANRTKLEEGQAQLATAQAELDAQKAPLTEAATQLATAQAELDAKKQAAEEAKADEAKADEASKSELAAAQSELDAKKTELEANQAKVTAAQTELDAKKTELEAGLTQLQAGQSELDAKKAELEAGLTQLEEAQAEIDAGEAELEAQTPELESGKSQLESGQAELDAQKQKLADGSTLADVKSQLESGQAEIDANRAKLESGQAELDRNSALLDMSSGAVLVSEDGSAAAVGVTFTEAIGSVTEENFASIRSAFDTLEDEGIEVLYDSNMEEQSPEMGMTGELIGIIIAFIVLLVMLGTLIAAGLPIIMAVIGLGAAMMGTFALSGVVEMNSTTPALGSMLGLAVGIDYTLFILNRHRNNLAQGMEMKKSIALATGTSGGAVVFAGVTVMIALLALNVVGIPFLATMGTAAAFAVLMAVLVSITLSPAVLSLVGRRIISKKRWAAIERRQALLESSDSATAAEAHEAAQAHQLKPGKWLKAVLAKPVLTIIAAVLALGALALPITDMRLGLPDGSAQASDSAAYKSYMAIKENFGDGQNGAVVVAATLPEGTSAEEAKTLQVEVGQDLLKQEDVAKVIPAMISKDNDMLLYQVIPDEGPNSESTANLVTAIRQHTFGSSQGQVTFGVTGQTAMSVDIAANLFKALPTYIAIVVGLSLIVLILVFRSIWVPITATVGFLFSLVAALGVTTAVFQWGWAGSLFGVTTPGPLLAFLPILVVGILFGLAMDYQVFLVSAMKEAHSHGSAAKAAVVAGFNRSAKVVVAAALIMTGVFMGFVFSGETMIASIGFALALGVLLDAFIVRMILIPALMHLLGEHAWNLPEWLDRFLPDLDIEGTKLEEEIEDDDQDDQDDEQAQAEDQDEEESDEDLSGQSQWKTVSQAGSRDSLSPLLSKIDQKLKDTDS